MSANGNLRDTLSRSEAAKLLRVCRQTVIKWADDGDLPCWRTSGGHRRFSAAELRARGYVPVEKPRLDPTVEAPMLQRFMAERANATIVEVPASQVSFVSQPEAATQIIMQAVEATAAAG